MVVFGRHKDNQQELKILLSKISGLGIAAIEER
jgi:hypothetical protein